MGSDNDDHDVDESIHLQQLSPAPAKRTVHNAVLETAGDDEEEEDVPSSLLFDQPAKSGQSRSFPSKQQQTKPQRSVLFLTQ